MDYPTMVLLGFLLQSFIFKKIYGIEVTQNTPKLNRISEMNAEETLQGSRILSAHAPNQLYSVLVQYVLNENISEFEIPDNAYVLLYI